MQSKDCLGGGREAKEEQKGAFYKLLGWHRPCAMGQGARGTRRADVHTDGGPGPEEGGVGTALVGRLIDKDHKLVGQGRAF